MKIQLKKSNVIEGGSAKEPSSGNMEFGELAVNYSGADPALFIKDDSNKIIRIAGANSVSGKTPGDGTITIKQPGIADQSFTVNQSGNTEINLKKPGNGALTIKTAGEGANATGTFTADQSNNSTLTLPAIRWTDLTDRPTEEEGSWTPVFVNDTGIVYNGQFGFYRHQGNGGVSLTGRIRWTGGELNTNDVKIQLPFGVPGGEVANHGAGTWLEATTGIGTPFVPTAFQLEDTITMIRGNVAERNLNNNRLTHDMFGSGDIRFSIFIINAFSTTN